LGLNLVTSQPHSSPEYATMRESSNPIVSLPVANSQDVLSGILRDGAQRLLTQAIEAEVAEWIDSRRHVQMALAIAKSFAMAICRRAHRVLFQSSSTLAD
jgi:hypothetical protein